MLQLLSLLEKYFFLQSICLIYFLQSVLWYEGISYAHGNQVTRCLGYDHLGVLLSSNADWLLVLGRLATNNVMLMDYYLISQLIHSGHVIQICRIFYPKGRRA
jgi:hypothetical protein